ncbi:MAG: hypothetical protein HZC41_17385 [Chloroflexi bacterium]|nr:hypothetical protein [Chloroflexota bacterium]
MTLARHDAPPPDLRILPTDSLQPHEEHDSQRAMPLIERLRNEQYVINPPIVAQMDANHYVILDGANRFYAFSHLHYPHILVQIANYDSGYVELNTWRHIVGRWEKEQFLDRLHRLPQVAVIEGYDENAIAHVLCRDGQTLALRAGDQPRERNAALCDVVRVYQRNAVLHRTALTEPTDIWPLYPEAIALVVFPSYQPADILAAAQQRAFLPPGISRHIIHGRALRVNYPIDALRDTNVSLEEKNARLRQWMQDKLARRHVRYYAEATYQFDE